MMMMMMSGVLAPVSGGGGGSSKYNYFTMFLVLTLFFADFSEIPFGFSTLILEMVQKMQIWPFIFIFIPMNSQTESK